MEKIRWGIAGPGTIANKFAKAVQNVEGAELTAVASRSAEKGQEFARKYGAAHVFESYEQMAASSAVDAVYVSTIHPYHSACAKLFLKAGKHVLCEKPLCVNAAQAMELRDCAKENGVFLMEAVWTRFLPAVQEALNIVRSGTIGQVMGVEADFCYASTPQEEEKLFRRDLAGGALLDVGVYGLHFASMFLEGEPEQILASSHVADGVDLHTQIVLKQKNGAVASLTSAIALQKPEAAYIYGTKGYLYLPTFYGAQELYLHQNGEQIHIPKPSMGEGFEEEICEVCACIRAGKQQSDILPLEESICILKLIDKVRRDIGVQYIEDETQR